MRGSRLAQRARPTRRDRLASTPSHPAVAPVLSYKPHPLSRLGTPVPAVQMTDSALFCDRCGTLMDVGAVNKGAQCGLCGAGRGLEGALSERVILIIFYERQSQVLCLPV